MMAKLIHITALILVFLAGCDDTSSPEQSDSSAPPTTASNQHSTSLQQEQPEATPIPKDITYTIIDQSTIPGIKRSLVIRLNKEVSEGALRSIALVLKDSDSDSYERTFISYLLPDMIVNAGCWATTHFNPNLKVRILGFTIEQKRALNQKPNDSYGQIIGCWLDERMFVGSRITIFQQGGKLYMANHHKDGSSGVKKLIEKKSPLGRRFEDENMAVSETGDHWLLDSNGNLQLRDNEGLIATPKKIK